jgi:N utilization substance protein B
MATSNDIRRLAFQTLFQLDARGGGDLDAVREHMEAAIRELEMEFSKGEREKAFALASGAYEARQMADAVMVGLAPTWPASRQAAVDRAILRLAHYEMTSTATPPKVVVNEAVELAKVFSTEKSPAFINGLLDKVLKGVLREREGSPTPPEVAGSGEGGT